MELPSPHDADILSFHSSPVGLSNPNKVLPRGAGEDVVRYSPAIRVNSKFRV